MFRKLLTTTAVSLTLCGLAAVPAHASPEDGNGCAGFPAIRESYVCVISATPLEALPSPTVSSIPVTVPAFCYVAGCTTPTTVDVPVPGAQPGSGRIAVLWYQGVYYPVSIGTDALMPIVDNTVKLVIEVAGSTVATVTNLTGATVGMINGIAGGAVADVERVIAGLPTLDQVVTEVNAAVANASATAEQLAQDLVAIYETTYDSVMSNRTVQAIMAMLEGDISLCSTLNLLAPFAEFSCGFPVIPFTPL